MCQGTPKFDYIFFDTPCIIARLAIACSIQDSRSNCKHLFTEIVSILLIKYLSMATIKYCSLRQRLYECFIAVQKTYNNNINFTPKTKRVSAKAIQGVPPKSQKLMKMIYC